MSVYAKSIVGAVAAVLVAGVTAWQSATTDGFQVVDLLPVAVAVASAVLVYLVPNVPQWPATKGIVAGVLAVLTAFSTGLTGLNPKADAVQIIFAVAGAFLSWYVPNAEPAPAKVGADGVPVITDAQPAAVPALPSPAPSSAVDPTPGALARLDQLDQQAAEADTAEQSRMGEANAAPLPIEAEAQQAAAASTTPA